MTTKTVLMPIKVPKGEHCWDNSITWGGICPHFDNEGGHPTCDLGFDLPVHSNNGVKKPKECLNLKES
jgi:hypothetical protein